MSNPFSNAPTIPQRVSDDEQEQTTVSEEEEQEQVAQDVHEEELDNDESEAVYEAPEKSDARVFAERQGAYLRGKVGNKSVVRHMREWEYSEDNPAPYNRENTWLNDAWFDVITTAGHEHMRIAWEYGFKTGGRLDNIDRLAEDGIPIHFIDMDWHNPTFDKLLEAAKKYRPEYIVGGDYDNTSSNIDLINDRAEQLRPYSENVIVCPHATNQVQYVPEWAVVGYSIPTTYGATEASHIEYHGHKLHLLGGAPKKQMRFIREFGENIVSIDGNSINKMANVANRYWTGSPPWASLVDPDVTVDRNFESYERSCLHWSMKMRERVSNGWFNDTGYNVLDA